MRYETVYIEINGESVEMECHFYYTPAEDGGRDYPSTDEDYNFTELYVAGKNGESDIDMLSLLDLPNMEKHLIEQVKTDQ